MRVCGYAALALLIAFIFAVQFPSPVKGATVQLLDGDRAEDTDSERQEIQAYAGMELADGRRGGALTTSGGFKFNSQSSNRAGNSEDDEEDAEDDEQLQDAGSDILRSNKALAWLQSQAERHVAEFLPGKDANWCSNNKGKPLTKTTKGVGPGRSAFVAERSGVHTITTQLGKNVYVCGIWTSVCGRQGKAIQGHKFDTTECKVVRSIIACEHTGIKSPMNISSCKTRTGELLWELGFA